MVDEIEVDDMKVVVDDDDKVFGSVIVDEVGTLKIDINNISQINFSKVKKFNYTAEVELAVEVVNTVEEVILVEVEVMVDEIEVDFDEIADDDMKVVVDDDDKVFVRVIVDVVGTLKIDINQSVGL